MALVTDVERGEARASTTLLPRPAWLGFHVAVAGDLVWLFWATSTPAPAFFDVLIGLALLGALGLIWLVLAAADAYRYLRTKAAPTRHLLVAPALVLVAFVLIATSTPLRVRWALSRSAFDDAVASYPDDLRPSTSTPARIGLYDIRTVERTGDAVIFYEAHGGLFDYSGFACLPSGPLAGLASTNFENPQFEHLDGCWYTWSASW